MAKRLHITDYRVLSDHMDCREVLAAVLRELAKELQEE